jgi:hypothetical protein
MSFKWVNSERQPHSGYFQPNKTEHVDLTFNQAAPSTAH